MPHIFYLLAARLSVSSSKLIRGSGGVSVFTSTNGDNVLYSAFDNSIHGGAAGEEAGAGEHVVSFTPQLTQIASWAPPAVNVGIYHIRTAIVEALNPALLLFDMSTVCVLFAHQ